MKSEDIRSQPFFSIILPFYNARETLERACFSCIAQSFSDFELILIDDGGTDGGRKDIESRMCDARVFMHSLSVNAGVSAARNIGISFARGQYIAFMDADDEWHPEKLTEMAKVIRKRPGAALYFHDSTVGHDWGVGGAVLHRNLCIEVVGFWAWLIRNRAHTPCVVVPNASAVRFNESLCYSEDYDLWLALAYPHGAVRVRKALTRLGRPVGSNGGLSAHRWQMRLGEIRCYSRLYRLSPWLALLTPVLVLWSFVKHGRSLILRINKGDQLR